MKTDIYKGRIFEVAKEDWNGHAYDIIHHHGGVGVLVVSDGKILLVRQYRPAVRQEMLEIPAGKLEKGEDPMECGLRELNEETGLDCDRLELLDRFYSTPGFCDEELSVYKAIGPRRAEHRLDMDPDEDIQLLWVPLKEAEKMARDGKIRDAKTLIALYRALLEEKEGGNV